MANILINLNHGLGDILFCQKIAHKLIEHGHVVYWPITQRNHFGGSYQWLDEYIKFPNLNFFGIENPDMVLDLSNSIESNHPYDVMSCKYKMIKNTLPHLHTELVNITHDDWSDYLLFERNHTKESELFYNVLGLTDTDEFILVNRYYGTNQIYNTQIPETTLKVVDMSVINGFTLFDWCMVIEKAVEIHTIDTSINYVIEKLNLSAKVLKMTPRHPEHTYKCLNHLFKTEWEWVQ